MGADASGSHVASPDAQDDAVRRRLDDAVFALARRHPEASAMHVLSRGQSRILVVIVATFVLACAAAPIATLTAVNMSLTVFFLAALALRVTLAAASLGRRDDAPPPLDDDALPVVTLVLPLFREADGLPGLAAAIARLDYPPDRLDVKLVLEADDAATVAAARRLGLDRRWDFVLVPDSAPKTKPKACNYALAEARGALLVIYDAEDEPEPDQLRKAAAAFAAGDARLACMQARLAFYNARENWLTRLFALEYCLWFDGLLPGLQRLGLPIPLGGTSNIFRTDVLRDVGGWDPFNVTEDADLGLRLARRGWRVEVLDSTTFEEANCRLGNWLRQRSRWIKGYMQTWLVHMREPATLVRNAGVRSLLTTQIFIGGTVLSALIAPPLFVAAAFGAFVAPLFPESLRHLNLVTLIAGNATYAALAVAAPWRRGWGGLAPAALLSPAYWALTSLAAYKALWQLATRPHYWEKTDHMISASARARSAPARIA